MGERLGYHHGRADLDRIGLFAEMGYLHGKGYTAPITNTDIRDMKNPQMNPGAPKWKSDLQDCYFDQKFKRIFEKEAYVTPYTIDANDRKELKKKYPYLRIFIPSAYPKKHASPGDYFGTFGGIVKAFSPVSKPRSPYEKLPLNVKTNPGKKGGPGYPDICINKYPQYKSSPYDDPKFLANDPKRKEGKFVPFLGGSYPSYFDKNPYQTTTIQATYKEEFPKTENKIGPFYPSSKNKTLDGCFSKWPEYKSSPYTLPRKEKAAKDNEAKPLPFHPQPTLKSMYTRSIVNNKVDIGVNERTWHNTKPITYTREFLV